MNGEHVLLLAASMSSSPVVLAKTISVEIVQVLRVLLEGFLVSNSVSVRIIVSHRPLSLPML